MIGNWEIQEEDLPSLSLGLGLANLDASLVLCRAMNEGRFPATFHHAKVIMSLAYHGIELFLKYGIGRQKEGQCPTGHCLRKLKAEYDRLNPSAEMRFDVPFIPAYLGFSAEEVTTKIAAEKPLDQYLRYHLDQRGNPWTGVHGVDPSKYVSELTALRNTFSQIAEKMEGQQVDGEGLGSAGAPPSPSS